MIPVISPNYFMQKASYMQAKLIADTIKGQSLSEVSQKFHTRLRSKRVKGYGAKDTASMYSN